MKRSLLLYAFAPIALSQMGATDCGGVIKDPGFDLWCGDRLCDWKTESGQALRVPTWHAGDDGVEMVGDDVLITQQTAVTSHDSTCIEFSMLTDVALDADVHLQFDVFGDGTIDYDQPIPTASWQPVSYLVKFAAPYDGIKFRLAKKGGGHAVLAEIKAVTRNAADCPGDPIALPPRPNGASCALGTDCASQVCAGNACGACTTDLDCGNGAVCGVDDATPWWLHTFHACIPAASRALGELCVEDAECASGVCNQTCSLCKAGVACPGTETCSPASQEFPVPNQPDAKYYSLATYECDPGQGARAHGERCFRDDDCASAHCDGAGPVNTCIDVFGGGDGRSCASDLDCPYNGQLAHTPCVAVGIAGGTCQ